MTILWYLAVLGSSAPCVPYHGSVVSALEVLRALRGGGVCMAQEQLFIGDGGQIVHGRLLTCPGFPQLALAPDEAACDALRVGAKPPDATTTTTLPPTTTTTVPRRHVPHAPLPG